jgi:sterol desaturase/sphingolipid hydroxylase (fatty acid hydroxylase superfamily)
VFVPVERLFALRPSRIFRTGILTDLGYYFINGIVPGLVLSIPLAAGAWLTHRLMPAGVTAAFGHWPLGMRIFMAFVVAEVGLYWGHRWCHEIPLLWRFHAVHHSPGHIDWLVNSRGHPVDFIFTRLCGLVPLYALGMATPMDGATSTIPLLVMLLGPIWGFFIHANVRWRFGPLEWLVATPAFHHWHHANDGPTVLNKNFAPTLPWIDWLFGTFNLPHASQPTCYGTETKVPLTLAGQLLNPFLNYGSIASTASAAHSDGVPEGALSKLKASANP